MQGETLKQMMKSAKKNAISHQLRGAKPYAEPSTSGAVVSASTIEELKRDLSDLRAEVEKLKKDQDHLRGRQPTTVSFPPKTKSNLGELISLIFHWVSVNNLTYVVPHLTLALYK